MADEKPSGGGNSLIILAAALVSAAYFVWQKPHLEGFRPMETLRQAHDDRGKQDVEARLWQDPLAAVQEQYERQKGKLTTSEDHTIDNARRYLSKSLVIGVMLPGGPYPEDSEARRRYRYAVLGALHTAKYDPIDENHLGYFKPTQYEPRDRLLQTWEAGVDVKLEIEVKLDDNKQKESLPAFIPFEKFKNHNSKADAPTTISILWLNEDVLDTEKTPIESIREFLCPLNLSNYGFDIIGPQYSQTLIDMVKEINNPKDTKPSLVECPARIAVLGMYNFGATADERILFQRSGLADTYKGQIEEALRSGNTDYYRKILEEELQKGDIDYYRTISTDRDLVPILVEELQRRGVDLQSPSASADHVVLISESDTFYGRSLRDTFKQDLPPQRLELFSYFRGLDGQLPGTKLSAKATSGEDDAGVAKDRQPNATEKAPENENEIAEGQGQFDYLLRLADHIHRLDDDIRHKDRGRIAAVGILGGDVYDKQLLIEALKPELPQALFFTTDLDALLLPHDKFRSTRNLIVVSSYGLDLSSGLQCDIAPFRTSYQSSIFLATRLAIRNTSPSDGGTEIRKQTREKLKSWFPLVSASEPRNPLTGPKLFQIGRSQVQALPTAELSTPNNPESGNSFCDMDNRDFLNDSSIDPIEAPLYLEIKSGSVIPAGLLIAILMLAIALTTSGRLRKLCFPCDNALVGSWYDPVRPSLGWLVILLVGVVSAGLGLSASWSSLGSWLTQRSLGEPMSLFEGISVWPTVALRAMSIALGVRLVFYTLESLKADLNLRRNEMRLPKPCVRRLRKGRSLGDRWYEMASLLWFRPDTDPESPSNDSTKALNCERTLNDQVINSEMEITNISANSQFIKLWYTYYYYAQKHWRLTRATIGALVMMALWFLLANVFGEPNVPTRGPAAWYFYVSIGIADVFVTFLVVFLVVDATLFSRSVVEHLTAVESYWPDELVNYYKKRFHLDSRNLQDWFDIKFIANRTRCITQLIYFPFIMLALLIVSRSPIFDDYTFTPTLVIVQGIILAIIIGSVASLRHATEHARKTALEHLSENIVANHAKPDTVSQLESLSTQVCEMQDGAFARPLSQPIVKAVLLPLASYGGTWLVQLYAMPGL